MTNCVNCGAILHGNKCEYCGTEYVGNKIGLNFNENELHGVLTIQDKQYDVYLASMDATPIFNDAIRGIDGKLHLEKSTLKHTFKLVEM